jgi:hypothetical protein
MKRKLAPINTAEAWYLQRELNKFLCMPSSTDPDILRKLIDYGYISKLKVKLYQLLEHM